MPAPHTNTDLAERLRYYAKAAGEEDLGIDVGDLYEFERNMRLASDRLEILDLTVNRIRRMAEELPGNVADGARVRHTLLHILDDIRMRFGNVK